MQPGYRTAAKCRESLLFGPGFGTGVPTKRHHFSAFTRLRTKKNWWQLEVRAKHARPHLQLRRHFDVEDILRLGCPPAQRQGVAVPVCRCLRLEPSAGTGLPSTNLYLRNSLA